MVSVQMHPAYEKISFDDVGVTLGEFWLYIGIWFVYLDSILILQPTRELWCTLGNIVYWLSYN